jgi:hypothetical protein
VHVSELPDVVERVHSEPPASEQPEEVGAEDRGDAVTAAGVLLRSVGSAAQTKLRGEREREVFGCTYLDGRRDRLGPVERERQQARDERLDSIDLPSWRGLRAASQRAREPLGDGDAAAAPLEDVHVRDGTASVEAHEHRSASALEPDLARLVLEANTHRSSATLVALEGEERRRQIAQDVRSRKS